MCWTLTLMCFHQLCEKINERTNLRCQVSVVLEDGHDEGYVNCVNGAYIANFIKVADAMLSYGIILSVFSICIRLIETPGENSKCKQIYFFLTQIYM